MSFNLGSDTFHVEAALFRENRERLLSVVRSSAPPKSVILLQGGVDRNRYNTDANDTAFRQESYFFWTFGVHESESYGVIDVESGKSILFPPRLPADYAIWEGKINDEAWFKKKYEVDEVIFNDKGAISNRLKTLSANIILLLRAENTDSGDTLLPATFDGIESFSRDEKLLYPLIAELRVIKTERELQVLRYAAKRAVEAHKMVMKSIKPGNYEYQMESLFRHTAYFNGGCRHCAYTCIAASGKNGAVLHYGHANLPNSRLIKDGDICLFDMGPEYNCYASDVTTSFPVNGKFTDKQKIIYNAVLRATKAVFDNAKPGVRWTDMHLLAEKTILEDLTKAGLLVGDAEEMQRDRVGAIFMPHGLGHFMGLDVHDVGGYLGDAIARSPLPGLKSLRTTRTLQERMVITIEPGCYFIDVLLDSAFENPALSKYLVKDKINEYRGFGGVRIEDDVIIFAKGNENMNSDLPRTVEEIEAFMASK